MLDRLVATCRPYAELGSLLGHYIGVARVVMSLCSGPVDGEVIGECRQRCDRTLRFQVWWNQAVTVLFHLSVM
jgi:hypothetical protein